MIKGFKVMLIPNNKQKTKLFQYSSYARFAYNWALAKQKENYENGGNFINDGELRKQFTQLKKLLEYKWLNNISNNVAKQAIKDACNAYIKFFKKQSQFPKFKSKKKSIPKFYQDSGKIQFNVTHVKFEGLAGSKGKSRGNKGNINWIRLAEHKRIPHGESVKYSNPRVSFDGLNWFISVGIECKYEINIPINDGIGIDLGIKGSAICSDKINYKNINKTNKVKKIEKKRCKLQRKISRKYQKNKEGSIYKKTCNILKAEKQLLKLNHRLKDIRHNYQHQITSKIVNRKPMFIVLEDLNVKDMMKNKYLAKAVQEQSFYEFYRQIQYKCDWNNIKFIVANRWFPSSKLCSICGNIKKNLKLSDRIYRCECGNEIDRDYQASINLYNYGLQLAI